VVRKKAQRFEMLCWLTGKCSRSRSRQILTTFRGVMTLVGDKNLECPVVRRMVQILEMLC
jgi:hypothetical protein